MIKLGNTNISELYVGSTKIAQAYVGSTLVYQLPSPGPTPTPSVPSDMDFIYFAKDFDGSKITNVAPNSTFGDYLQQRMVLVHLVIYLKVLQILTCIKI